MIRIHNWFKECAGLHEQHSWYDNLITTFVTGYPCYFGGIPNQRVLTFEQYTSEIGEKEFAIETDFWNPLKP